MTDPRPVSPFAALKPMAGRALEAVLNRALALDPDTQEALKALDGRRIEIAVESPPLALQVRVEDAALKVGPVDSAHEADLSVRSTLGALVSQLPFLRRDDAPPVGRMRVSGDADLARRLQRLAERFDPDWQQPFVAVFGDVIGVQVATLLASALKQVRTLSTQAAESAAEYVTEESRDVVARDELAAFHDDVDTLHDDVERIAARIANLQRGADARTDDARADALRASADSTP